MPEFDGRTPRLFADAPMAPGSSLALDKDQSHYLLNVLRQPAGAAVLAFNGRDGEWLATVETPSRKQAVLALGEQVRPQPGATDLHYAFAPLKHARLDYVVQKAVEMGASVIQPVLTQHTQVARLNRERMRANAIEAAEQCGILTLPEIRPELRLEAWLAAREPGRRLVFCDEGAPPGGPLEALAGLGRGPVAVLVGPEGGFAEAERARLVALPGVTRLSLGPRILRADTAAVAVLALVQAALGDWQGA